MDYNDLYLQSTDSTNRVARERGRDGCGHGSGVVADSQRDGRGRQGRSWFSPAGKNLYCSYIVRPALGAEQFPRLTMAAGVAAAHLLREEYTADIGLKWPNDLYIGARKCGGILCETATDHKQKLFAVIGYGINCNLKESDFPEALRAAATSLMIESGSTVDSRQLFLELRSSLLHFINLFEKYGFTEILGHWRRYDTFRGRTMAWARPNGSVIEGENRGPDEDGALIVRDSSGAVHRIVSGEVTSVGRFSR